MKEPDPRKSALSILNALDRGKSTLDYLLTKEFDDSEANPLSRRDRNFAYALIYGVLRWRARLDWIIGRFSKNPIEKIDPVILNILRIGLFQIFHLTRVPESAAVNTSVELAKGSAPAWVVRFVNGLLRNVIRNKSEIQWPDESSDRQLWLAADQSFPLWLISRWIERFGYDETRELCLFLNTIAPLTLRTNILKISREQLVERLQPFAETITTTPFAPEGISLDKMDCAVQELPGYAEGFFQVQDEAAQLVAYVLAPEPGDTVLDACAGLGGKTGHIAQLMSDQGRVFATDKDKRKLDALDLEMGHLGVTTVTTRQHDLNQGLDHELFPLFDRILLDAPCSGIGVIRRNPDTKWSADPAAFPRHRATQERFLGNVARRVRPGGVLVYSVCSIAPEETDEVVSAFLKKHTDFVIDIPPDLAHRFASLVGSNGSFRSLPHIHNMDGFFIARMKRIQ